MPEQTWAEVPKRLQGLVIQLLLGNIDRRQESLDWQQKTGKCAEAIAYHEGCIAALRAAVRELGEPCQD